MIAPKEKEPPKRLLCVNPVVSPATPVGMSLIRTSYTATHTEEQMDRALKLIKETLQEIK